MMRKIVEAGATGSITACCAVRCPAKRIWMAAKLLVQSIGFATTQIFMASWMGLGYGQPWIGSAPFSASIVRSRV